jgi:sugar transferase (PEP-CTERM system associated)
MVLRIFRHFIPMSIILLALSDLALIFLALYLTSAESSLSSFRVADLLQSPSLWLSALIGLGLVISGLYHAKAFLDYRSMAIQIAISFGFVLVIAVAAGFYVEHTRGIGEPLWDIQKAAFSWLVCILVTRAIFLTLVDHNAFKRRVLVFGTGARAARIAALVAAGSNRYFIPAAYLSDKTGSSSTVADEGGAESIASQARHLQVSEIVIAAEDRRGLPLHDLLQCRVSGIKITDYLDFIERETKTVDLPALQPGWLIFSDGFRASRLTTLCKRCFDLLFSISLLLLTLPLMLLTTLLIIIDSPGPVLYRQTRIGAGGRQFVLLKFRSMHVDAEKDGVARWASTRDPRVTRVGSMIRKIRIDELPQLFNVLRGDMSVVGPRPERPALVDELSRQIPFYAERHCAKPGITGWAQINYPYGASPEDARMKLAYDLYYVKNQGPFLDIIIVLQTVRVILWADGAR